MLDHIFGVSIVEHIVRKRMAAGYVDLHVMRAGRGCGGSEIDIDPTVVEQSRTASVMDLVASRRDGRGRSGIWRAVRLDHRRPGDAAQLVTGSAKRLQYCPFDHVRVFPPRRATGS